jgi:hypothetical protein
MSDLSKGWFEEFVDNVRVRGRWGLLPHRERVLNYLEMIEDGREIFPIDRASPRLLGNEVARKLGVTFRLQIPEKEWRLVLERLKEVHPEVYQATVRRRSVDPLSVNYNDIQDGRLTVSQTVEVLAPFARLWSLRKSMAHDPIGFRPFDHQTSCFQLAEAIASKPLERTLVPPPEQVCWLVDGSCRLIMDCENLLKEAYRAVVDAYILFPSQSDSYRARKNNWLRRREYLNNSLASIVKSITSKLRYENEAGGESSILAEYSWQRSATRKHKCGFVVRDLLFKLLPAACAVVIAALTARRNSEIARLHHDCISIDENGDPNLSVWIAKTLRRLDSIPVPASVVSAVNVLTWLTEKQREATNAPWLFSFADPAADGRNVEFRMNDGLKMLAAFTGVPALPDGSTWDWKAHQFRTFFGVTYYWRFDFPSLTALSDFFRHFNPTMTRSYVTRIVKGTLTKLLEEKEATRRIKGKQRSTSDELSSAIRFADDRVSDFERCQTDFLTRVAKSVAEGKESLSGRGGEVWNRELSALVDKASTHVHLAASTEAADRTFNSLIAQWVQSKKLEPHPGGHSFCKCGTSESDLATAACLRMKKEHEEETFDSARATGPDYAYAADLTCSHCPHNVQRSRANERYWVSAIAEAELASERGATEYQRRRAKERTEKLREHHRRCFKKADK